MPTVITNFFNSLPKLKDFAGSLDDSSFYPAPDDWLIVLADIEGSTQAVTRGRYKEVNMVGGAVICAVRNATDRQDWPFVFGGDGATLLVAPSEEEPVRDALIRMRAMAQEDFNLELRIGLVPVSAVRQHQTDVLVARYETSIGNSFALFGGGGVQLAEQWLKSENQPNQYLIAAQAVSEPPDLTGLSCRWEPIPARRGRIVCVMVKPRAPSFRAKQRIVRRFLDQVKGITGEELNLSSPVKADNLFFRWPPSGLPAEAKATRGTKSYIRRMFELSVSSFVQLCLQRWNLTMGSFEPRRYREEMCRNSDHCKFDDVLRMVLDCSADTIDQLKMLLSDQYNTGEIEYGFHVSDHALMTCLLYDLEASQHQHFIDGDDGGFYMASLDMKQRQSAQLN